MGWMSSWVAVKDVRPEDFLQAVQMEMTDKLTWPGSKTARFYFKQRDNGWSVLFSEDFEWASRERVLELSRLGLTLGCQFEDKVDMTSTVWAVENGVELWRVHHDNTQSKYRLDVSGDPPAALEGIKAKWFAEQDQDGGEKSSVDYIHEVPLELAKSVCGFMREADDDPDEDMDFIVLKRIGDAGPEPARTPYTLKDWLRPLFKFKAPGR